MRRNDECRAENFITGKKRYRKWIVTISILSIIVAVGTLYLLNKPATAVSEDGASSVGMVLGEGSSAATVEASANDGHGQDAVHVASVTEGTSEDGSSVSSSSASSASTASSASDSPCLLHVLLHRLSSSDPHHDRSNQYSKLCADG